MRGSLEPFTLSPRMTAILEQRNGTPAAWKDDQFQVRISTSSPDSDAPSHLLCALHPAIHAPTRCVEMEIDVSLRSC